MNQTLKILNTLDLTHEHFNEYGKLVFLANSSKDNEPDICIETCKSLFEGIAHVILRNLNPDYVFSEKQEKPVAELMTEMFAAIGLYAKVEAYDYIVSFVHGISLIRNERGEISHGKPYPKDINSEKLFSNMVLSVTDSFVSYILQSYFTIQREDEARPKYDEHEDFNNWLDEQDRAGFMKSYSRALFETDPVRYETELKNYYPDED